jgi:threonine dehydrogenase-like Zn-dependent dehydrogenase
VYSIATDVIDAKLEMAKKMGADILINSENSDLRTAVLSETNNDGAGRIVEATGFSPLVNSSFSMLRYCKHLQIYCVVTPSKHYNTLIYSVCL